MFERSEFAPDPDQSEQRKVSAGARCTARLFFGYFLLAKQKKVAQPPGRNPGQPEPPQPKPPQPATPTKPTPIAAPTRNPSTMSTATSIDVSHIRINSDRLWDSLMRARRQIGATPKGGVCRLTLTDLDKQGRDLVLGWARDAGMTITIDKIGNGFMRRAGRNNSLPPIMTGSHIDTQPTGGKFDGNYGVLAGIEVVRTLNDLGIETEAPIEVAFWTNEEGSRFVPVMMGSGVFAKAFTLEHAYAATRHHRRLGEGGAAAHRLHRKPRAGRPPDWCVLRNPHRTRPRTGGQRRHHRRGARCAGHPLVSTAPSPAWRRTPAPRPWACAKTPCRCRPASMQEVVAAALRHPPHGRGTVGMVQVFPNSRNVIPGRVEVQHRPAQQHRRTGRPDGRRGEGLRRQSGRRGRAGGEDRTGVELLRHWLSQRLH